MKPGLLVGMAAEVTIRVTREMCPHFDGVLVHPVYATWTVVHHMELAGRRLIAPYLDADEEAVGVHISVDHRSPAAIGATVRVQAQAIANDGRRLTCRTGAWCGPRLIAEGEFVQAVLKKTRLKALLEKHAPEPG